MLAAESFFGLGRKSTAPNSRAWSVASGATAGEARNHHDRHRPQAHQARQEIEAIHFGHLDIQRQHVRRKRLIISRAAMGSGATPTTTSRSGAELMTSLKAARIKAESSTMRTFDCHFQFQSGTGFRPSQPKFDVTLHCRVEAGLDIPRSSDERVVFTRTSFSSSPVHFAGKNRLCGVNIEQILRHDGYAFGTQIIEHELGVLLAHLGLGQAGGTCPPPKTLASRLVRRAPSLSRWLSSTSIAYAPYRADDDSIPPSLASGSMKWFIPPKPLSRSRMQAVTQDPSTVTSRMSAVVTKYSPGKTFTRIAVRKCDRNSGWSPDVPDIQAQRSRASVLS